MQAQNLTKLTALEQQQQDSDVRLAELKKQHSQLRAQLQHQVQHPMQATHPKQLHMLMCVCVCVCAIPGSSWVQRLLS